MNKNYDARRDLVSFLISWFEVIAVMAWMDHKSALKLIIETCLQWLSSSHP